LAVVLTGCGGGNAIVGTWESEDFGELQLNADGTGVDFFGESMTWETANGELNISTEETNFAYTVSGNQLILTLPGGEEELVFTRANGNAAEEDDNGTLSPSEALVGLWYVGARPFSTMLFFADGRGEYSYSGTSLDDRIDDFRWSLNDAGTFITIQGDTPFAGTHRLSITRNNTRFTMTMTFPDEVIDVIHDRASDDALETVLANIEAGHPIVGDWRGGRAGLDQWWRFNADGTGMIRRFGNDNSRMADVDFTWEFDEEASELTLGDFSSVGFSLFDGVFDFEAEGEFTPLRSFRLHDDGTVRSRFVRDHFHLDW